MTSKIERAITRAVSEKQRGMKVAVYATDLVSDVYGNARPTRGQLLAVLHEMRSFVRKHQAYVLAGGQGPSRLSIIMTHEVPSAAATWATPGGPSADAAPERAPSVRGDRADHR